MSGRGKGGKGLGKGGARKKVLKRKKANKHFSSAQERKFLEHREMERYAGLSHHKPEKVGQVIEALDGLQRGPYLARVVVKAHKRCRKNGKCVEVGETYRRHPKKPASLYHPYSGRGVGRR
jgi:hypothetical protein